MADKKEKTTKSKQTAKTKSKQTIAPKKQTKTQSKTREKTLKTQTHLASTAKVDTLESDSLKKSFTLRLKKKNSLVLGIIVIAVLALIVFRGFFVAAIVNGQPISRISVIKELERQAGKQTLDNLITKTLILQEAGKQNATVSDKEIDDEIKKIEDNLKKQGQDLNQVLQSQGISRDVLREQIRIQKLIEKMIGKNIKVTDEEARKYAMENKSVLGESTESQQEPTKEELTQARQQVRQQKLTQEFQNWIQKLHRNANISYIVSY